MSDVLKALDLHKLKQKISLSTEKCLNYARQNTVNENDIVLTVNIPYELLRCWYDLKQDGKLPHCSYIYVEILNAFISQHGVKIKPDCERIDNLLRRCCGEVKSRFRKLKGRPKAEYATNLRHISIFRHELVQVTEAEEELKMSRNEVKILSEEKAELLQRCEELSEKLETLHCNKTSVEQDLSDVKDDYNELLNDNKELKAYIERVGSPDQLKNIALGKQLIMN